MNLACLCQHLTSKGEEHNLHRAPRLLLCVCWSLSHFGFVSFNSISLSLSEHIIIKHNLFIKIVSTQKTLSLWLDLCLLDILTKSSIPDTSHQAGNLKSLLICVIISVVCCLLFAHQLVRAVPNLIVQIYVPSWGSKGGKTRTLRSVKAHNAAPSCGTQAPSECENNGSRTLRSKPFACLCVCVCSAEKRPPICRNCCRLGKHTHTHTQAN